MENTSSVNTNLDSEDKENRQVKVLKKFMNKVAKKGIGIQSKDSDIKSSKTLSSNSTKSTA